MSRLHQSLIKEFQGDENFQITSVSSSQTDFAKINELKFSKNLKKILIFIINSRLLTPQDDKSRKREEIADLINPKAVVEIANFA